MLRPFLVIGVGGSGGKTLRALRHAITLRLEQVGWRRGIPAAWQMLHFDTPVVQDGSEFPMPMLPAENYKGLVATGGSYESVHSSIVFGDRISKNVLGDVERMLPDPNKVDVVLDIGAGQYRGVGRVPAVSKLADIGTAVDIAMGKMTASSARGELGTLAEQLRVRTDGDLPRPTIIVVTSIAGGSGAGQYLDIIEAAKERIGGSVAENVYSLLYAPDVFSRSDDVGGVAANALAAIAETSNGFWTPTPSAATIALYNSRGLSPATGSPLDRVGAAYPFIIGRQNSKVSFDGQSQVYMAVSASLAAWMLDDKIQNNIDSYVVGNFAAAASPHVLPDMSGLMIQGDNKPPFLSLGFGRVTLGRDRFLDYSSERFTRSVVDRILYAHTEEDPRFEVRKEEAWIEYRMNQAFDRFIKDAKLDEETEDRNDVIDALRPEKERAALSAEFRSTVVDRVGGGFDRQGGLPLSDWQHRLLTTRDDIIQSFIGRETAYLKETLATWIQEMPEHLIDTVERAIASFGMPVTVELLRKLSSDLRKAEANLEAEAATRRGWAQRLSGLVSEALSDAPNQESIRPDQDAIEKALDRLEDSFGWEVEANLRQVASKLLAEFREDFIDRLRDALDAAKRALITQVTVPRLPDGRENDYLFWPRRQEKTVPRKYKPAPNEQLLVPETAYPAEFERLVENTMGTGKFENSIIEALAELVRGPDADSSIPEEKRWSTITTRRLWQPSTSSDLSEQSAKTSSPIFMISDDLEQYLERSRLWMLQEGAAFSAYIQQDLQSYFDQDEIPVDEYRKRVDNYREALDAAAGSSEPLVKLNPGLLSAVHGKSLDEPPRLVFSAIPFKEGTEMFEVTKTVLSNLKLWDDAESPKWFQDVKVDNIEIFAMSRFPYQAMVMDSIMDPVVRGWLSSSGSPVTRSAFWKWKRARNLREAVPVDPDLFDGMVRGWYVAKVLGQLTVDTKDSAKGPKIGIWDSAQHAFASFPHPLLYRGTAPGYDYPGAVMESTIIATALASGEGSLAPLRAYHLLTEFGGDRSMPSQVLDAWLIDGALPDGSPTPDAARAGAATGTIEERKDAVRAQLDKELQRFDEKVVRQDLRASVYSYPVSWEIRDTVTQSLGELRDSVLRASVEDDDV